MTTLTRILTIAALLLISACSSDEKNLLHLAHWPIDAIHLHRIADYAEYWRDRADLHDDHGILLDIVPTAGPICVGMAGLRQSVDAAFFDAHGRLLDWRTLPIGSTPFCSPQPAHWLLEMSAGWYARHHLQAGDALTVPSEISQP